jgi:branched-chain amino acid transport system substrate-binding protein
VAIDRRKHVALAHHRGLIMNKVYPRIDRRRCLEGLAALGLSSPWGAHAADATATLTAQPPSPSPSPKPAAPKPAPGEPGVSADRVLIGQSISLAAGARADAASVQAGVRACIEHVNAAGGVHGRRIELRALDDHGQARLAHDNVHELARAGVFALFGATDPEPCRAVADVCSQARIPFIGPMTGAPSLRRPHAPMIYPVRADIREEFRGLLLWARAAGMRSVGFFHIDSPSGLQLADTMTRLCAELGMRLTLLLPCREGIDDTGIARLVATLVRERPDVVLDHGLAGDYARFVAAARRAKVASVLMATNAGSAALVRSLGVHARGLFVAQVVPNPSNRHSPLVAEYQDAMRKLEVDPAFDHSSLEGYMTAKALSLALRSAGRNLTRTGMHKALDGKQFDLGGVLLRWRAGNHEGSSFVDVSMVDGAGRLVQ